MAMLAYPLGVKLLIHFLRECVPMNNHRCKEVAFADDFTIEGKTEGIRSHLDILQQVSSLFGYFPQPAKFYLLVKEQYLENAVEIFRGTEIKITTEGKTFRSSKWK